MPAGLNLLLADVRGTVLAAGLPSAGTCAVLLGGRLQRNGSKSAPWN
ncbi:hypothetical protein ACFV2B_19145 [Streptomyces lavendulae]